MSQNAINPRLFGLQFGNFPKGGPKSITFENDFSVINTFKLDALLYQQNGWTGSIQGLYIDNSKNAAEITIQISGTGQRMKIPPRGLALLPLFAPDPAEIIFQSVGLPASPGIAPIASLMLVNFPVPAVVWQSPGEAFIFDANGNLQTTDANLAASLIGQFIGAVSVVRSNNDNFVPKVQPNFISQAVLSAGVSSVNAITAVAGQGWYLGGYQICIQPDSYITGGLYSALTIKDNTKTLADHAIYFPSSAPAYTSIQIPLVIQSLPNHLYNATAANTPLVIALTTPVTGGGGIRVFFNWVRTANLI